MSAEDLVSKIGVLCDEHSKLPETCGCEYLDSIYELIIRYRKKAVGSENK